MTVTRTVTATQHGSGVRVGREARGRVSGDGIEMAFGYWPGSGPTVVGLHGVTASYVNFVGIAQCLAGRRPLLAPDLRGRGDTDKPVAGPFGMAQHADDVAAAMRAFGLDASLVVGHSMGAYVALALADQHPDLVRGIVLVDGGLPLEPPPGIDPAQMLDVVLAPQMERLRTTYASFDDYLAFWRALPPFSGGRWNHWVEDYLRYDLGGAAPAMRPKASETAVRGDFVDTSDVESLRARLRRVEARVLMLRATEGFNPGQPPLMSDDVVAREGALVANFTDRVVPDTTHYTIALGPAGAAVVADAVVEWAEACGR